MDLNGEWWICYTSQILKWTGFLPDLKPYSVTIIDKVPNYNMEMNIKSQCQIKKMIC